MDLTLTIIRVFRNDFWIGSPFDSLLETLQARWRTEEHFGKLKSSI